MIVPDMRSDCHPLFHLENPPVKEPRQGVRQSSREKKPAREYEQAETAISLLACASERFQAILDTVDVYMCLINRELQIVWANRRTKEMFGGDIVGKPCHAACHGSRGPCGESAGCIVRQAFRSGSSDCHETVSAGKNGGKKYFSGIARVIQYDHDGGPLSVVRVYNDITDQVNAEKRLRESLIQLRKNLGGTIQAMAMTVETRDPYTAGHQRRTSDIARCIAGEMGLPEQQVDGIRMAGVIHDLGKISVPAEILSKPGKIGRLEYSLIKNHPQTGYNILQGIDFRWPVAEIVRQHHERLNGSGYPYGLKGDRIMLEARVIGVADVIEAMSSHRPYRPSLGLSMAFDEITRNRGKLYDPDVVDATVRLYSKKELNFH